jgi:hypothetical protein
MTVELFEIRMQESVINKTLGIITQTDEKNIAFAGFFALPTETSTLISLATWLGPLRRFVLAHPLGC